MKKLLVILLAFSLPAMAASLPKPRNRSLSGDLIFQTNQSGTLTEVARFSSNIFRIPNGNNIAWGGAVDSTSASLSVLDAFGTWQARGGDGMAFQVEGGNLGAGWNTAFRIKDQGSVQLSTGGGFYTQASGVGTTSAESQCASADGTFGFDANSGHCLFAWNSGTGASITCADTTSIARKFICVAY